MERASLQDPEDASSSCRRSPSSPASSLHSPLSYNPGGQRQRYWHLPYFILWALWSYLVLSLWLFLPYGGLGPWEAAGQGVACNVLALTTAYCYFCAFYLDPTVDVGAVDVEEAGAAVDSCAKCGCFRPERAHHCTRCGRCIHRFDHHCDWIDNCVGAANHKPFFLFLFYITLVILHYWFLLARYLSAAELEDRTFGAPRVAWLHLAVHVYVAVFSMFVFPLTFFAGGFFLWTGHLLLINMTTYDRTVGGSNAAVYNVGTVKNLKEVLGHPLLWLVPVLHIPKHAAL